MDDYGFSRMQSLFGWAVVGLIGTLALIAVAAILWRFSQQGERRAWLRAGAALAIVGALGLLVVAQRAWAAYSPPVCPSDLSDYGFPSLQPLLYWAVVGLIGALVLGAEAGVLWEFSRHGVLRAGLRAGAVLALVGALGLLVFAQRAWADYSPPLCARTYPPAGIDVRNRRLHDLLLMYQTLGWIGVGVTIALLALGAILVLASRRGRAEGLGTPGAAPRFA
jgi:hypothetical protein